MRVAIDKNEHKRTVKRSSFTRMVPRSSNQSSPLRAPLVYTNMTKNYKERLAD